MVPGVEWTCPRCGRRFVKPNQAHSCRRVDVESHFTGKPPELRRLFGLLTMALEREGPLRVDAVPASIHLVSGYHFAGVRVRRDHLRVGFLATTVIEDARIVRRQVLGPNRVEHEVILRSDRDLTPRVRRWLAAAQRLQARKR
jgi:hypothetical protein